MKSFIHIIVAGCAIAASCLITYISIDSLLLILHDLHSKWYTITCTVNRGSNPIPHTSKTLIWIGMESWCSGACYAYWWQSTWFQLCKILGDCWYVASPIVITRVTQMFSRLFFSASSYCNTVYMPVYGTLVMQPHDHIHVSAWLRHPYH